MNLKWDSDKKVQIIECPRDAMQGWHQIIPTNEKLAYISLLDTVGFDILDCGSFVSYQKVPQMKDTEDVIKAIELIDFKTKLLVIVANFQGALKAIHYPKIKILGYPFSISETFQLRNSNRDISTSFELLKELLALCKQNNKELNVYISMGFGNPYGDTYNTEILNFWIEKIFSTGVKTISIADTIGCAIPTQISELKNIFNNIQDDNVLGLHLHSDKFSMPEKIEAALEIGCRRFDSAINGIGGCPFANDQLIGNIDTIELIKLMESKGFETNLNSNQLEQCKILANKIFQ